MRTEAFKKSLFMMERVLNMNTYQDKIGQFKHFYPNTGEITFCHAVYILPRLGCFSSYL